MLIVYEIKEDPELERDIGYAARYMIDVLDEKVFLKESL